jgi:DNA-binding IclR family transcriptional regulator
MNMPSDDIADDMRDFILTRIESVAHIEALLLLCSNPSRGWTIEACAQRLYIPQSRAAQVLDALSEGGFLAVHERDYRFSCRSEDLAEMVVRFADLYREKLIAVTKLVHSIR